MSIKLKSKSRKKKKNNSLLVLLVISFILLAGLGAAILSLSQKARTYQQREQELESQIALELKKAETFKEQEKYRQTLKFVEEIARERLNLVFPDEIIVIPHE
ncbi:MAG: septum formation initiator family protein [Lachnospiraceae bacterium]|nr:septum formation initiator family protein [Lachnospiraceae bacterium]